MNLLNHEVILGLFRDNYLLFVLCLFSGAFAMTFYLIPKVLWVSKEKNLMAEVVGRSAHSTETPSFGGVAFYMTLIMVLALIQSLRLNYVGSHLIGAITILFMVGLKDDLVISSARVKLFGQIAAACFLVLSPEMHLTNLHGFWGIYEIPEILGLFLTTFLVIALINAYNLIDGIDGLAALVGIVISTTYAVIFFISEEPYFVLISVCLGGILSAFLRFNYSQGRRKIFMGDSGSLIVGLILAFLSIKLLVMAPYLPMIQKGFSASNRLLFVACILFIPVFDTLRVILLRLLKGDSPFSADKEHTHHILLDLGLSHKKTGFFLTSLNILVISIFWYFSNKLSNVGLTFLVLALYCVMFLIFYVLKKKSILRMDMIDAEARSSEAEKNSAPLIKHNGVEKGIKVGRPEKIQPRPMGAKFKVRE
ncbi:MraY family glycosyltransferase [Gillisia sp. Q332]|uniref:MraY family glycosyltransferase n=1 Tax=Gillisia xinjiangensis TaxID=3384765 RepID=UPI003919F547